MALQTQITFRHMNHSSQVERWIREEAEKLQTFYGRITGCRVAVEVPHRHHQKGKRLHVRIDLNLPGKEIIVKREPAASPRPRMRATTPTAKPPHADLRLVIHEAFKAAGRRVQDFARRQQGRIKVHQLSS
ncbi:MAG TPA: HPF/RaiA family ribosome-associated protein [Terriglobales bacterium]|nr:HPF/RaiA family ribosome-associated protein [Terriglobales bacterium]